MEYYKELFDLFDVKKTGVLTPIDLRALFEMFGYHTRKESIYQIISEFDQDESGGISFYEFLKIMTD